MDPYVPFCGEPPLPGELFARWTFEPVLLIGLALFLATGLHFVDDRRRFLSAWVLVAFLFVSPLCAASMALFSARVGQHILLTLLAAPLFAASLPVLRMPALPFAAAFAVLFWAWHAPGPYEATLRSDLVYWSMHLSLFSAATVLFAALRGAPERGLAAAALTASQMSVYAALVVLAPEPWHGWHELTAVPYGLTAHSDQQLAGALMWVGGGALFLGIVATLTIRFLGKDEASLDVR